jgi:hypothetical protein
MASSTAAVRTVSLSNGVVRSYSWYSNTLRAYASNPVGSQNNPETISADEAGNFTLYMITLRNSPFYNVIWLGEEGSSTPTTGLTIWGIKIIAPYNIFNTDGIDPADNASNITITNSYISNGDDQVALHPTVVGNPVTNVSAIRMPSGSRPADPVSYPDFRTTSVLHWLTRSILVNDVRK